VSDLVALFHHQLAEIYGLKPENHRGEFGITFDFPLAITMRIPNKVQGD